MTSAFSRRLLVPLALLLGGAAGLAVLRALADALAGAG